MPIQVLEGDLPVPRSGSVKRIGPNVVFTPVDQPTEHLMTTTPTLTGSTMTLPTTGAPSTMSSREIAELTGKEHKNVLADIRSMLTALEKDAAEFSASCVVPGPYGRSVRIPTFNLPQDLTITLVSGYNVVMRHRIVTRWRELEAAASKPQEAALKAPGTLREALLLALAQEEKSNWLATAERAKAAQQALLNFKPSSFCRLVPERQECRALPSPRNSEPNFRVSGGTQDPPSAPIHESPRRLGSTAHKNPRSQHPCWAATQVANLQSPIR